MPHLAATYAQIDGPLWLICKTLSYGVQQSATVNFADTSLVGNSLPPLCYILWARQSTYFT